jgi:hypothetical protein
MSRRTFRSPSSTSIAVATAPSRLAAEVGGRLRWRELGDGTVEVAALSDDGRIERLRVEGDGSTTPVSSTPAPRRALAFATLILGLALFIGAPVLLSATDPGDHGEHPFTVVAVLVGFALVAAGGVATFNARDLDARLKKEHGRNAAWNEPLNLGDWEPRSAAQLHRVEQLADDHEGVAYVRDVGARTIEVYTRHRGRFEHYWVDEDGRADLLDSGSARRRYLTSMSLERRVQQLRSAGGAWHQIHAWIEEADD